MTSITEAPVPMAKAIQDIINERLRQLEKHGDQSHLPDGTGPDIELDNLPVVGWGTVSAERLAAWAKARCKAASQNEGGNGTITYEQILTEEWAEAIAESDPTKLREELVQLATVAVAWIEKIDNKERA